METIIRTERKRARMTQAMLGKRVGVVPNAISQYESGARRPKIEIAKKIAAVLEFDWKLIYEDEKKGKKDDLQSDEGQSDCARQNEQGDH